MSVSVPKSHNVSTLLYHALCPATSRRVVFPPEGDATLKDICRDLARR